MATVADSQAFALRSATSADVKQLAAMLARAFYDDPPLVWLLPNPSRRLGRITRMWATVIEFESLRYGGVDVACGGGEILGGAIWMPPGRWEPSLGQKIRALPGLTWALGTAPGRTVRFGRALSGAHPREPHWYLQLIGVDPGWQGRGVASLLLRSRLKRCDQDGQSAYLEASKPGGVPLYEHFGFRRTRDLDMPEGAPAITAMWRPPGP
jgi:GNAT superfamily N-acetyltransferase